MKKITLSAVSLILASLVFVFGGCEMSLNLKKKNNTEDTQSHTAIVEVTDEKGAVIATEAVTISQDELKKGETFFNKDSADGNIQTGVSSDRLQQALANSKNNTPSTNASSKADSANKNTTSNKTTATGGTGNSVSKPVSSDNGGSSNYVQNDADVLKSTQYMITGRAVYDGEASPYKVARSGEKLAMFAELNGQQIGIIITEEVVYMLSVDEKTYIEITKEMLKENMTEEELSQFNGSALDVERKVKENLTQKEDGVTYNVVVYEDGVRDYFVGTTIMKTISSDGSVLYYDSVSPVAPASVFAPPSGYKRTTLDEAGVSEFIGAVDATENHTHTADE